MSSDSLNNRTPESQVANLDSGLSPSISPAAANVLRNTYRLLSATLIFSAITATTSAVLNLPHPGLLLTLAGYFGLLFLTSYLRNSAWGLVSTFALTGFMGYTLGPILNVYLSMSNGGMLVGTAMATTGVTFLALSAYARSSGAINMLRFGTFLLVGILVAFCLSLAAIFLNLPALSLAISGIFVLLMSGLIMYETQNITSGGETNYIMATITLFVAVYNLFASLLHILGFLGGED
ncbi:MAG: Bax inhibitor-1/YccA family protein [Pseudomonadota bacterium]